MPHNNYSGGDPMTRIFAILVAAAFSGSVLAAPSVAPLVPVPSVQADKAGAKTAKKKSGKAKTAKKKAAAKK